MSQPLRTPYPVGIGAAAGIGTGTLPTRADTLRARTFTEIDTALHDQRTGKIVKPVLRW